MKRYRQPGGLVPPPPPHLSRYSSGRLSPTSVLPRLADWSAEIEVDALLLLDKTRLAKQRFVKTCSVKHRLMTRISDCMDRHIQAMHGYLIKAAVPDIFVLRS